MESGVITVEGTAGKHEAREYPFGGNFVVFRQREVVVLDGRVLAPRFLETVKHPEKYQGAAKCTQDSPETHAWASNPRIPPANMKACEPK